MKARGTLILGAVFALLAGYLFFFELNRTPEQINTLKGTPTAVPLKYVLQLDADDVQTVQVRDLHGGREIQVARAAGGWQVVKPDEKPAELFRTTATINRVGNIQASRVITGISDLRQFGLVTPTLEIRFAMTDTKTVAIVVGGKTPDGSNYYVTYSGGKEVYVVNAGAITDIQGWFDAPPYEPTPTPTFAPTPAATPTPAPTATPPLIGPQLPTPRP